MNAVGRYTDEGYENRIFSKTRIDCVAATSDNQLMQIQIQLLLRIIHISVTQSMKSLFCSQMSMSAWEQRLKIEDQSDVEVMIRHL